VRQMLRRIEVEEPGDSPFITGEQVEPRGAVRGEREGGGKPAKKPATYRNILLGITKASACRDRFVHLGGLFPGRPTRVLTEAAIMGKRDELRGLKEKRDRRGA